MNILAIETSCDETAVAVTAQSNDGTITVLSNIVASQIELHARYGGVVPNLAAREHERAIIPTITEALATAQVEPADIDVIAVTQGPGLIPALLIGVTAAKTLSYLWHKPLIGIHHLEGHIYANLIENSALTKPDAFPLLALIVSGGHTQLVLMRAHLQYEIIGQTQDDAVGEAFDKVARMLGLSYPGGPEIAQMAEQFVRDTTTTAKDARSGHSPILAQFGLDELPRPMLHSGDFNMSFSGIKTSVLYKIKDFRAKMNITETDSLPKDFVIAMSTAFQDAICDVLIAKTLRAAKKYSVRTITIAGGVSANTQLRAQLGDAITAQLPDTTYTIPPLTYCLDNATMIAAAAHIRWQHMSDAQKETTKTNWNTLDASAQLPLQ